MGLVGLSGACHLHAMIDRVKRDELFKVPFCVTTAVSTARLGMTGTHAMIKQFKLLPVYVELSSCLKLDDTHTTVKKYERKHLSNGFTRRRKAS